jgi:S1-C subfamily serine protease
MIRIPEIPEALEAAQLAIERIEIPEIDEEALNQRLQEINEELRTRKFLYLSPDGGEFTIDESLELPEGFELEIEELSELAEQALGETDIWFGLPHSQGLELAQINEGLGAYFETDRGVLVIHARDDNAYRLKSGDVVLGINETSIDSPADLMRALREIEPGSEIELTIKRDLQDETLKAVMPENRLGFRFPDHGAH